jgi:hypothetical protein
MGIESLLRESDIRYGKYQVPRNKVSPFDKRHADELTKGHMRGGDRMNGHGYAKIYAKKLWQLEKEEFTLVEVGILSGSGLAIWMDAFPRAHVIGFDIDLGHFERNLDNLKKMGAFWSGMPTVKEFDQLQDQRSVVEKVLGGRKIKVCIDDGLHTEESIVGTIRSIKPFLEKEFIYFVEDVPDILEAVQKEFPGCLCVRYKTGKHWNDELVVVTPV